MADGDLLRIFQALERSGVRSSSGADPDGSAMSEHEPAEGWRAHVVEQRRAWQRLSHADRLAWLEQAKRFCAEALGAARRGRQTSVREPENSE